MQVKEESWRLTLTFSSPDKHFVSKNKKVLPVEIRWEDGLIQSTEMVFYPTLWRDGDVYTSAIKHKGGRIVEIKLGSSQS